MSGALHAFDAAKHKRGAKGTNLGGEFIGPKSVAHYLLGLLGVPRGSHGGGPDLPPGGIGHFRTRGGAVVHVALPARNMRPDDRIIDPADPKRMGVVAWVHGDTMRVNWDDGSHEVKPVEQVHDPLRDPARSYLAEHRSPPAKLDVAKAAAPEQVRQVEVENKIRAAYARLRRPDGPEWVGLADLRNEIGDGVNRIAVDDALRRLLADRGNRLIPEENQKTITDADRRAAINLSGEPKHLLSMHDPSPRPLPTAAPRPQSLAERRADAVASGRVDSRTAARLLRGESPTSIVDSQTPEGRRERLAAAAPSPAAAKVARAKTAKPAFSVSDVHARLAAAQSMDEGRAALQGLTMAQLREVSPSAAGVSKTKADLVDSIARQHVGGRLAFGELRNLPGSETRFQGASAAAKVAGPGPRPQAFDAAALSASDEKHLRDIERLGFTQAGIGTTGASRQRTEELDLLARRGLVRRSGRNYTLTDRGRAALGIEPASKSPAAAKVAKAAPAKRAATGVTVTLGELNAMSSREQVATRLASVGKPELLAMARSLNIPRASTLKVADLRREIVDATVGRRIDSIATRGFTGPRP